MAFPKIARSLVRAWYPYGSVRRVLRGDIRGMQYQVAPGMAFTYAIPLKDSLNFRWFRGRLAPGMVVYDIGANRGQMSLFFSKRVGPSGKVYAFEPYGPAYQGLVENLRLNAISNVITFQAAVGNESGKCVLEFDRNNPTQSKLAGVEPLYVVKEPSREEVDLLAIDDVVVKAVPPTLMKIDVEGGASSVLSGAQQTLAKNRPLIYIELHGPEEQTAVNEYLIKKGYEMFTLDDEPVRDAAERWRSPLWGYKPE